VRGHPESKVCMRTCFESWECRDDSEDFKHGLMKCTSVGGNDMTNVCAKPEEKCTSDENSPHPENSSRK
jgi:hypothetical protein